MSQCSRHSDYAVFEEYLSRTCHLCALEKRVEELSQRMTGLEMKHIESMTIQLAPSPEPKLYSGFTADEWKQMLVGGPLLCGTDGLESAYWIDSIDEAAEYIFRSGLGVGSSGFTKVTLLEQPNWRSHMTDNCPVPGRVNVQLWFTTPPGTNGPCGIWLASLAGWNQSNGIRAYRILGV